MAVWLLHGVAWAEAERRPSAEPASVAPSSSPFGAEGPGTTGRVLEAETGLSAPAPPAAQVVDLRPALTPDPSRVAGRPAAGAVAASPAAETLRVDDLLAVVSVLDDPEILADPDRAYAAALAHHEITLAWALAGDFAPSAFGLAHRSEADLRAAVAAGAERLRLALAAVAGSVEYVLKAKPGPAPVEAAASAPASGRGYLAAVAAARAARRNRGDVVKSTLTAARADLLALATDATPWTPRGEGEDAGYGMTALAPRDRASAFEAACADAALRLAADAVALEVTGPWPCAVFARAAIEASGPAEAA